MVPSKVDGRNPRHVNHLQELQTAYPMHALMVPVARRVAKQHSWMYRLLTCPCLENQEDSAARKASQK